MLFKILKLLGLDVHAKIAEARLELSQRVEEASDYAKKATLTAALVAALSAIAALLAIAAIGVGVFALYRVIAEHYGVYAGLATVAGLLIVAASALLLAATTKAHSLSNLRIVRQSPSPAISPTVETTGEAAHRAPQPDEAFSATSNEFASDLFEPLAFAFAKHVRFPTFENPVLEQFVEGLKGSALGTADDAVRGAATLIRHGSRTQLLAILGSAAALGWLLARQNSAAPLQDIAPSG
jgi:hypothetical protein